MPLYASTPVSSPSFFLNDTATTEIYTLSLHDALPICQTHEQRPPAVRAEEPDLAGALLDLAVVVGFRAPGQPPPGEEHVEAGQDGQPDAQCERDSPRRFLGCVPVHDVGGAEKDPAAEEQPAFDLHLGTPPLLR